MEQKIAFSVWLILLLFLASCAEKDNTEDTMDGLGADNLEGAVFPLDDLLDADEQFQHERELLVEEEVARCMREEGFDYAPTVKESDDIATSDNDEDSQPGDPPVDDSVSTDNAAYERALYGPAPDGADDFGSGEASDDPAQVGCYNASWVRVFGEDQVVARWRIVDAIFAIDQTVAADPSVVAAGEEWEACMAEEGFVADWRVQDVDAAVDSAGSDGDLRGQIEQRMDHCERLHLQPVIVPLRSQLQVEFAESGELIAYVELIEDDIDRLSELSS